MPAVRSATVILRIAVLGLSWSWPSPGFAQMIRTCLKNICHGGVGQIKDLPQGLKPLVFQAFCGTAEAVP